MIIEKCTCFMKRNDGPIEPHARVCAYRISREGAGMEDHGRDDGLRLKLERSAPETMRREKLGTINMDSLAPAAGVPLIIASSDEVRLVACRRADKTVDLTFERKEQDALGAERWAYIHHWHIGPVNRKYFPQGSFDHVTVVLALLLGPDLYGGELSENRRD